MPILNKMITTLSGVMLATALTAVEATTPEEDREQFVRYNTERFPNVPAEEFVNGAYAIDPIGRENWEAIEEFPPYEPFIEDGEAMWNTPFANGKGYSDCFPKGPAIAADYPRWDREKGMVVTLPLAVNQCRQAHGEKPLKYKKGSINNILSYIAYESRGEVTRVEIPADDPRALAAYEAGKKFYFTRRGQLNFSCANCHLQNSGNQVRSEILSPPLGHTTHWPVYRAKWGTVGTLHRRFSGCNENIRAKALKAQGEQYRNLEYFLTYLNNGQVLNGPGARK
ncbi:MAG: sulfur oxidation c-type cytochrome SoxA [Gammaproteobacteria bacterium]|nr:sulfur oxidation c-type cytochrome SoxA [Gammaproteobacteria bacterium]